MVDRLQFFLDELILTSSGQLSSVSRPGLDGGVEPITRAARAGTITVTMEGVG